MMLLLYLLARNSNQFVRRGLSSAALASECPKLAGRPNLPGSTISPFPQFLNNVRENFPFLVSATDVPQVNEASSPRDCANAVKEQFHKNITQFGAILYRDFPIDGADGFAEFYNGLGEFESMGYVGGAAVRKQVGKVYTASDEPPEFCIELHNEMAYLPYWPTLILFYCHVPPGQGCGGESGISDVREQLKRLDPDVVEKFEKLGVQYYYHWRNKNPDYKSWQDVFWTEDREDVDKYMAKNGFVHTWNDDGSISYYINRPAVINHPKTGEKIWFNHIHKKHASSWLMHPYWQQFNLDGKLYPTHTLYGDGTEIEDEVIQHIRNVAWEVAVGFQMQRRDVLILENHIVQHSRLSFTGERKLLAALLK